jgi:ribokinase
VVTQGADGVLLISGDSIRHVPAPSVNVRDTTGAGDTFNGVLAARLAAGDDLSMAVPYAVAAAALSVTEAGARGGMPTAAAIEAAMP